MAARKRLRDSSLGPTVLITGSCGNLGSKLRRSLEGRYPLLLIDRDARDDPEVTAADLASWQPRWTDLFNGAKVVVHLAADATAQQRWPNLIGPNIDAVLHVFHAAALTGVERVIFASSNHVMGGYKEDPVPALLTTDLEPRPGTEYTVEGERRNSRAYGATKLFGERVGKCFAESQNRTVIAVRLGWVRPGGNRAEDIPVDREAWFREMWLSDDDYCHLMECCIRAPVAAGFHVINGMSANTGMRWDLSTARALVGYDPKDDIARARS
jgi:NAD+ dependent glucose-6-phosphate dehydrogenase